MNPILHHKWNNERDVTRGSAKDGEELQKEVTEQNKIKLKQNKPR